MGAGMNQAGAPASRLARAARPSHAFKLLWGIGAVALGVIYTAVLAPLAAISGSFYNGHAVTWLGWLWAWLIIKTCGVRVEVTGRENVAGLGPCIYVANHQSFFDIFAGLAYLPGEVRMVAKKELLKIPVFGFALQHSRHIVIDRDKGGQAIRNAIEVTELGYSIVVFAEGHRFSDNTIHPFSDGAAWMAIMTKLPCVPLSISGSGVFFPRNARLVVPGGTMRMAIGKPISTAGLRSRDRAELTRQLEEAVRADFVQEL